MLIVQEVHRVRGRAVEDFEAGTQRLWEAVAPLGVEPAWYFEVSHGTGPSYCVVTALRLPDWEAWEALARAAAYGDLAPLVERLDAARYDSESSVFEVLREVATSTEGAGLWVERFLGPEADVTGLDQPGLALRRCLGAEPGRLVVLQREPPGAVLDILTGTAKSRGDATDTTRSTWVLRPAAWSPLQ